MVIKNIANNQYYIYPIEKTALNFILDKNLIIESIEKSKEELVGNKYYKFSLNENNILINLFFDKYTFNIIGWQTTDIYQKTIMTYLSEIQFNKKIDKNIFKLPKANN